MGATTARQMGATRLGAHRPYMVVADTMTARTAAGDLVDLIAVERAVNGDLPAGALTRAEQRQAVHLLFRTDLSSAEIARRLGMSADTVQRWRAVAENGGVS